MVSVAHAASGTWTDTTTGPSNWSDTAKWSGGIVADASGSTASFTSDITASTTVTLDSARTITNIVFSDNGAAGSPWVLSGGNTLTLAGTTPTLTTTTDATISSVITGTVGMTKAGSGLLALSAQSTYTGNTVVNGGVLSLTGGGGGSGTIRGTVTVNTGATLRLATGDATGYNGGATALTNLNIVGGTLDVSTTGNQTLGNAVINLTGGSMTGVANSNLDFFNGSSALNSLASPTTSTISGVKLDIRQTQGAVFTVAKGTTVSGYDLDISSVVSNNTYGPNPFTKAGAGTLRFLGANAYTGATNVNAGTLVLDYTASNTSKISSTTATSIAGGATLQLTGNAAAASTQAAKGLNLTGGGTAKIVMATAAGQTLGADFSSGTLGLGGSILNVSVTGTGTAQLKLPGTTANSVLPYATYGTAGLAFARTDASNFVTGGTTNNTASDLGTWVSGATQYVTTGAAFTNSVGAGVVIDGITFNDAAARTVTIGTGNTLTLNAGVLVTSTVAGNASIITGGTLTTSAGGTLALVNGSTGVLTLSSKITDNTSSKLAVYGPGEVNITSGTNDYAGGTTLNNVFVRLSGGNQGFGTGAVTVNGSSKLATNSGGGAVNLANPVAISSGGFLNVDSGYASMTFSGAITGAGGFGTTSSGTTILTAANTYTGATFVGANTLSVTAAGSLNGSSGIQVAGGGTFTNAGNLTVTGTGVTDNAGSTVSLAVLQSGTYNNTAGTVNFGSMGLNGTTNISGGTLTDSGAFFTGEQTGTGPGVVNQSGGTVNLTTSTNQIRVGHWSVGGNIYNLTGGTLNVPNAAFQVGWDGTTTFKVTGTAVANLKQLTLGANSNNANTAYLGDAFTGNSGGTLNLGTGGIVKSSNGVVSLGNGTVGAYADWTSTANLTLTSTAGTTFNTLDSVDLTTARNVTLSGVLSGAGSVVKTGAGTLTLSGTNTYTGDTVATGGTLSLANASLADVADVKISNGAMLNLGFAGTDTIDELYIDGVQQASGTWGSPTSSAVNKTSRITGTGILQVNTGAAVATYEDWATAKGLTVANNGKAQDPDGDGRNNLQEFAFDEDPLSGKSASKMSVKVATVDGQSVLTLTLPVRAAASFPDGYSGMLASLPVDGFTYYIMGSVDLTYWNLDIAEVPSGQSGPLQANLPPLSSGWIYRSFYVPGAHPGELEKLFMRASVSE
ncbi:hypothetical protein llg_07440 [Luteolibacter sp. LG18]|nr:hypothetical protein llg_07440 [Luteolibacter sp. LG18]